ncbi:MAG: hypothetical protein LBC41_02175 [Clostridiales bacterium]|nr:hypothetical protein [Clostridiales bacterium]MDR2749442.1 hypothetical protein [Clostridiales bacterium]
MRNKTKELTRGLLALAISFLLVVPAFATEPTASPAPVDSDVKQELESIQSQLNDLYSWIQSNVYNQPTTEVPTEKPVYTPLIKVSSPLNVNLTPGKEAVIEVFAKNVGSSYANGVLVQASTPTNAPFSFEFQGNSNVLSSIRDGGTASFFLVVHPDSDAAAGNYTMDFKFSYKDEAGVSKTDTDIIQLRVAGSTVATYNPVIKGIEADKTQIEAGTSFNLSAVVSNPGSADLSGARVEARGSVEGVSPNGSGTQSLEKILKGGEVKVSFSLSAPKGLKDGSYPVTLALFYPGGPELGATWTYYVDVSGGVSTSKSARVEVTNISGPSGQHNVGQVFDVVVSLKSAGPDVAKNVKVIANAGAGGEVVPISSSIQSIPNFEAGETRDLVFSFAPTVAAKSQNYMIGFTVSYENGTVELDKYVVDSFEQFAGVLAYNPSPTPEPSPTPIPPEEPKKISSPRIIIQSYKSDPVLVQAGSEFDLLLEFKNTHRTKTISNIKVVLSAVETVEQTGSVFMPVNGSNTLFMDEILPGETSSTTLRMYTVPNALARTYSLKVHYSFQDNDYNNYEDSEEIGINVRQVTKLEVGEYSIPSDGFIYQPTYFSFNIINSGKVNLNNLRVSVEADMDTSNANIYMGALKLGSSAYFDGYITPMSSGTFPVKVIVSCEDDSGTILEDTREFLVTVAEEPVMDAFMPDNEGLVFEEEEQSGIALIFTNPWIKWGSIAGGVVVIAVIIIAIVASKRRKSQKGWLEDE